MTLKNIFKKKLKLRVPYKVEPTIIDEHENCYTQSHLCCSYDETYNTHTRHKALKNEFKPED